MRPFSLRLFAAGGCVLLCACNDTSNLAPGAPERPGAVSAVRRGGSDARASRFRARKILDPPEHGR